MTGHPCLCLVVLGDVDTQHDLADMVSQLPTTEDYVSKHHSVTKALHYASVWHYATIIHFQRRIRHKPPEQLQDIVSEALTHLEAAEDVATDLDGCVVLWPCMVIASECYDEAHKMRALNWFKRKERHGFANVSLASTICLEYWKWRDSNPFRALTTSWQDFVAGTQYDVVPV
uniref:Uncharacterized protein n=1 Tax=Fusarium oxysporum (strain Fo5176) TaxID=660025 RepID=A0A0D2Y1L1_FUSOF